MAVTTSSLDTWIDQRAMQRRLRDARSGLRLGLNIRRRPLADTYLRDPLRVLYANPFWIESGP